MLEIWAPIVKSYGNLKVKLLQCLYTSWIVSFEQKWVAWPVFAVWERQRQREWVQNFSSNHFDFKEKMCTSMVHVHGTMGGVHVFVGHGDHFVAQDVSLCG
jgi:hypothetical protein